jgi:hypothetical protein
LRTATYEHAKRAAPGWDVYELERQWREWIEKKGPPQKPDAAFVAFCRNKFARKSLKCEKRLALGESVQNAGHENRLCPRLHG